MSKYLAAAALLLAAGAASADLSFSLVPVDNTNGDAEDPLFSTTWDTYDMVVTVTGDDDWTAAEALITVDAPATIFQHPFENADQSPRTPRSSVLSPPSSSIATSALPAASASPPLRS
jgi:hypothetical protein